MSKTRPPEKPTKAMFDEAARLAKQDSYIRQPARGGRVAALDLLFRHLVDDGQLYESEDLQDQRDAVAHSLLAVGDFLIAQGFPLAAIAPLMRPAYALAERENNTIDPMFAERVRVGRPKATLAQHERTGILAALSNYWLSLHRDEDHSQSEKLAAAARKMTGPWFGEVERAQLETARELVSQEAKDHPAVNQAAMIASWLEKTAKQFGEENAFQIMVQWLNDMPLSYGTGAKQKI